MMFGMLDNHGYTPEQLAQMGKKLLADLLDGKTNIDPRDITRAIIMESSPDMGSLDFIRRVGEAVTDNIDTVRKNSGLCTLHQAAVEKRTATTPKPADYDGDGKADLAVFHTAAGNWYIKQSSNGQSQAFNWGWSSTTPVPKDYDGDGKADAAVYYQAAGNWYIKQSSNGQTMGGGGINWGWSAASALP